MLVPNMTQAQRAILDKPRTEKFRPLKVQPAILTGGQLKGFQLEGLNFMYQRWWIRKGCFLADEMGLGKTVRLTHIDAISFAYFISSLDSNNCFTRNAEFAARSTTFPCSCAKFYCRKL